MSKLARVAGGKINPDTTVPPVKQATPKLNYVKCYGNGYGHLLLLHQ